MAKENWTINGYEFMSQQEYEKAKKEGESVLYIKAHTNMENKQQVLQIYNKAVEQKMFKTIIGYEFLHQLYAYIVKNKIIEPKYIKPIPVCEKIEKSQLAEGVEEANKLAQQYRVLYENCKQEKRNLKIICFSLVILIFAMVFMVWTNYSTYDEDAILDTYSSWEAQLQEREQAILEKEQALGIKE